MGENNDIRKKALETIRFFPTVSDTSIILKRLSDVKEVQIEAIQTLSHLGVPNLFPHLVPLLKSPEVDVVRTVILALGHTKDPRALKLLLNIRDPEYRSSVALALPRLIQNKTIAALMKRLSNADWKVRLSVVRTIGEFKEPEAIPGLPGIL